MMVRESLPREFSGTSLGSESLDIEHSPDIFRIILDRAGVGMVHMTPWGVAFCFRDVTDLLKI